MIDPTRLTDEQVRDRFLELLFEACGKDAMHYLAWVEMLAQARTPVDAMRECLAMLGRTGERRSPPR